MRTLGIWNNQFFFLQWIQSKATTHRKRAKTRNRSRWNPSLFVETDVMTWECLAGECPNAVTYFGASFLMSSRVVCWWLLVQILVRHARVCIRMCLDFFSCPSFLGFCPVFDSLCSGNASKWYAQYFLLTAVLESSVWPCRPNPIFLNRGT